MILSKASLEKLIEQREILIEPLPEIKEASIKLHLSGDFSRQDKEYEHQYNYLLKPKEFLLARSKEKISLSTNYAGLYDGYTHLARKGIITHLGSMFIDPGTNGYITLEIFNASNQEVLLEENMRVGHIIFFEVK